MKQVSILLSCFNGTELIESYVDSLCNEEVISICTLIVVNFPFSHKDPQHVEKNLLRYPDLILLNQAENISLYEAWNIAAAHAKTEFVSNLNLDDRVDADYYSYGVQLLQEHRADVFSSAAYMTSEIGKKSANAILQLPFEAARFNNGDVIEYGLNDLVFEHNGIVKKKNIPHCTPIWRKSLHADIGWFDSNRFDFAADFGFWLRAAGEGKRFIFSRAQKTLFYAAPGTASDRLIHPESQAILDNWSQSFPPPRYKETHLGKHHDLLHHCMNLNTIFSSRVVTSVLDNLVTVVIIAHERPDLFKECLISIRYQSYQVLDCIIILDGVMGNALVDAAQEIIGHDSRFRVVRLSNKNERNYARNLGVELALGKWICFVDGDDRLPINSIADRVAIAKEKPGQIVCGGLRIFSETGVLSEAAFSSQYHLQDLRLGWPTHCSLLTPLDKLKPIRYPASVEDLNSPSWMIAGEDVWLMIKLLQTNSGDTFVNCGKIVYEYRRHSSSSYLKRYLSIEKVLNVLISEFGIPKPDDVAYKKSFSLRVLNYVFWWASAAIQECKDDGNQRIDANKDILLLFDDLKKEDIAAAFRSFSNDLEIINPNTKTILFDIAKLSANTVSSALKNNLEVTTWLANLSSEIAQKTNIPVNIAQSPSTGALGGDILSLFIQYQEMELASSNCKMVVVMGNGPSAKLLDFNLLKHGHIATVGMNAAYRYWDEINFRPTYYICMDTVVILSHAEAIYRLINEGRIKRFFLRDELKDVYPDLASNERVYWYSVAIKEDEIFQTSFVTTGSWSIRWMAREGMQIIATVGIDANYAELLPEAKKVGGEGDIRLEIKETPRFNPNYFFSGYQQAGDKYNIPNDPDYIKKNGGLVHIDALKAVTRDLEWLDIDCKIIDLSPISHHGAFEKMQLSQFFDRLNLTIVSSFREEINSSATQINIELAIRNLLNPFIKSVTLLFEGCWDRFVMSLPPLKQAELRHVISQKQLHIVETSVRPNYFQLFSLANQYGGTCIVQNSDIYLPKITAENLIIDSFSNNNRFYAITRWNLTNTGTFLQSHSSAPPWSEIEASKLTRQDKNYFSFDSYVFDAPIVIPDLTKRILLGSYGCDTALAAIFKASGFNVGNPCLRYETIHIDDKHRNYDSERGNKDLIKNVECFEELLKLRYTQRDVIKKSLQNLSLLRRDIAWIGHRNALNAWQTIYRALGATAWSDQALVSEISFKKLCVTSQQLIEDKMDFDPSLLIDELESQDLFLEWELSGFEQPLHIVDLLSKSNKGTKLAAYLKNYPWMSMVHVDKAEPDEILAVFEAVLVIKDCLSQNKKRERWQYVNDYKLDVAPIRVAGGVTTIATKYIFKVNDPGSYFSVPFEGIIKSGTIAKAVIQLTADTPVRLKIDFCRDGGTPYESTPKEVFISEKDQIIEVMHCFEKKHRGIRVQISCVDKACTLSNVIVKTTLEPPSRISKRISSESRFPINTLFKKIVAKNIDLVPLLNKSSQIAIMSDEKLKKIRSDLIQLSSKKMINDNVHWVRLVKETSTSGIKTLGDCTWHFKRNNNHKDYLKFIAQVENPVLKGFSGGLTLVSNVNTTARISLARHDDSPYEGESKEVNLVAGTPMTIFIAKIFKSSYSNIKLQIEILKPTNECQLRVWDIFINESAAGVLQRLSNVEITFANANKLYLENDYLAACVYFLILFENLNLKIYQTNLLRIAALLGWDVDDSITSIKKYIML